MESVFASLKKELVYRADIATRAEARAVVVEYIDRGRLQHQATALVAGVHLPGGVRTDAKSLTPCPHLVGDHSREFPSYLMDFSSAVKQNQSSD
jgi:hypothetical protein